VKTSLIIFVFFSAAISMSQVQPEGRDRLLPTLLDKDSHGTNAQASDARVLFHMIENGIKAGDVARFSHNFDRQIFVNITSGENGYFSSGQATSLLQHFLGTRKVVSFTFSRVSDKGPTPYATGRLVSIYRGTLESSQVYVSCSWQSSGWVIGQFNIY
jgi:Domain of unknown function (DUF4783)